MFRKYDILKKRKGMTFLYNFDTVFFSFTNMLIKDRIERQYLFENRSYVD